MLLEAGANPNLQLKRRPPYRDVPQDRGGDTILAQGATPLLRAARAGDAPFVDLLLSTERRRSAEQGRRHAADGGCRRRVRHAGDARTEPHDEGVLATMQLLFDAGANINARTVTDCPRPGEGQRRREAGLAPAGRPCQPGAERDVRPHQTAFHGAAQRGSMPW